MDSLRDKMLVVDGYMKKLTSVVANDTTSTCVYPKCLNNLIMTYVDNIWNMNFDLYPAKYKNHIQENGKLIVKPQPEQIHKIYTRYIICSSQSISHRINEFRIKCVQPKSDCIGITSNTISCNKDDMFWSMVEGNLYYYWSGGGIFYGVN
eukprot:UN12031